MAAVNGLVGGGMAYVDSAPDTDATEVLAPLATPEGVEWAVALLVLGALAFIILFRMAGFTAVIAASAKVGS